MTALRIFAVFVLLAGACSANLGGGTNNANIFGAIAEHCADEVAEHYDLATSLFPTGGNNLGGVSNLGGGGSNLGGVSNLGGGGSNLGGVPSGQTVGTAQNNAAQTAASAQTITSTKTVSTVSTAAAASQSGATSTGTGGAGSNTCK